MNNPATQQINVGRGAPVVLRVHRSAAFIASHFKLP